MPRRLCWRHPSKCRKRGGAGEGIDRQAVATEEQVTLLKLQLSSEIQLREQESTERQRATADVLHACELWVVQFQFLCDLLEDRFYPGLAREANHHLRDRWASYEYAMAKATGFVQHHDFLTAAAELMKESADLQDYASTNQTSLFGRGGWRYSKELQERLRLLNEGKLEPLWAIWRTI